MNFIALKMLIGGDTKIVEPGGTNGKLWTPLLQGVQWSRGRPHLDVPRRPLIVGDELLISDNRVRVAGQSEALPRFPPRSLLLTFQIARWWAGRSARKGSL
jgi:putative ABC transport system permease protein